MVLLLYIYYIRIFTVVKKTEVERMALKESGQLR